jgi:hypothetical protein
MTDHPQLAAALQYASIGWAVFPVGPDKKPLVATGFHAATLDEDEIRRWWTNWKEAGIGVACLKSGLFVMDLDRNHGNARDGVQAWKVAQMDFGDDERGLMASTPSGGNHIVYIHPGQKVTTCNNVMPDSGIDVRGDGGYFIVPSPSDPGRDWEEGDPFEFDSEDGSTDITNAPDWVLRIVQCGRASTSMSVGIDTGKAMTLNDQEVARIRSALEHVPNTDHDVWIMVGMALRSTFAKAQAFTLWTEWSSRDYSGFDEHECIKRWQSFRELRMDGSEVTLGSLFHKASDNGWLDTSGMPELPFTPSADPSTLHDDMLQGSAGFPSELLNIPGVIGDLTHYIGYSNIEYPQPSLGFGAAMAIVSGLMGSIVQTEDGRFSNLYIVGLGASGSGKDAPKDSIVSLLEDIDCGAIACSSSWTGDAAMRRELDARDDSSPNAKRGRVASIDEFGDWLSVANDAGNANKREMRALLLEVWGSSATKIIKGTGYSNVKERPSIDLKGPCLTMFGVSTPDKVYESLGSRSNVDGLSNRLLFIRVDNDIPDAATKEQLSFGKTKQVIVNKLSEVAQWIRPKGFATTALGNWDEIISIYSPEAAIRLKEIGQEVRELRRAEEITSSQADGAGMWVRAPETIRRVATVFACGEMREEVSLQDVTMAEKFVRWSIKRTKAEMAVSGGDNDHMSLQRSLMRVISKARRGASRGALANAIRGSTSRQRNDALAHLIEAGDVEERHNIGSSGPPKTTYHPRSK